MPTKKLSLSVFTIFITCQLHAQFSFYQELQDYVIHQEQEKIYLHLDKPHYIAGEDIWFKAYVVNAVTHQPTTASQTMYVELIDSARHILNSLTLFIENGSTHGSLSLTSNLASGTYRLRAYTNWMRNFDKDFLFRRGFNVFNTKDQDIAAEINISSIHNQKTLINFLPEGGDLLDGIASKLAIRATNQDGKGKSVNGIIVNQNGTQITTFETNEQGYGLSFFIPKFGESYHAVTAQSKLNLPEVKNIGAVIRATHSHTSEKVMLAVLAKNKDLSGGTLVLHRHGQYLLSQPCPNTNSFAVSINKSDLGYGIINVTFFDNQQVPLTERLIFPNPPSNDPTLDIISDKDNYDKRSKVNLLLSSTKDTIHSASITVNPIAESTYPEFGENIENYILFTSDLKGHIESPGYYLNGTADSYQALDLLMLTHGWSRFNWSTLLHESPRFSPGYLKEGGLKISGKARNFYNDKTLKKATIGVSIPSIGVLNETVPLGDDGIFQIDGFSLKDSSSIYLQVYEKKQGENIPYRKADIELLSLNRPAIEKFSYHTSSLNNEFIEKANTLMQISNLYFLDKDAEKLQEVVITARSIKKEEMDHRTLYTNPSHRMILDSLNSDYGARSVFDLLRNIAGINVSGTFPFQSASLARSNTSIASGSNNGNSPLYVIDGMPADSDLVNSIPVQNVEFIDVLKGPRAGIYGSRGAGGVILIYTRLGVSNYQENASPEGFFAFIHPGYHQAKEFYSPRYDIPKEEHKIPDFRTTLYWNPELKFLNGKSKIDFYTSDQTGPLTIRLEGILTNGEPFFEEKTINVEQNY